MPRSKSQPKKSSPVVPQPVVTSPVVVKQNNTILYVILVVLVAALGFMFYKMNSLEKKLATANTQATQQQAPPPTSVTLDKIKPLFAKGYVHFGDAKRKLLFVEVSDPSCPYCHIAAGQDPELAKQASSPQYSFQYNTDGGTYDPPVTEMRKLVDEGKASYALIYAP